MIFTRKRINLTNFQLDIDNHVIERQSAAKFLGVMVDEKGRNDRICKLQI
jgi:hypothetical protein